MHDRIEISPKICHGRPVIKGTRVMVANILGALSGGDSIEVVLEDYPNITREDVLVALAFGGELSQFQESPTRHRRHEVLPGRELSQGGWGVARHGGP